MPHSNDEQMRRLAASDETPAISEGVSVRLSRPLVNRTSAVRIDQLAWRGKSQGGMKAFLQFSRTMQRLPAFGKGRRE
jgi:hypothetical protein